MGKYSGEVELIGYTIDQGVKIIKEGKKLIEKTYEEINDKRSPSERRLDKAKLIKKIKASNLPDNIKQRELEKLGIKFNNGGETE